MKVVLDECTLYLGDCHDVVASIEGIDACISDPPYGLKMDVGLRKRTSRNKVCKTDYGWQAIHGDDEPFDPAPFLGFPKVILWGGNHYADKLPAAKKWIIWDKREHTPPDFNSDCEMAWTNLPGVARVYRHLWRGMVRKGRENISNADLVHPTQKPVELMKYCVEQAKLEPGSVVFDPFMGSGTLGIACVEMGMKYIGVEIDQGYFDIACARIKAAQRQGDLFV